MLRKISNFGVVFPYTAHNLCKIIQLVYTHRTHVINFLGLDV
jgi:hypothetical protein